MNSYEKWLNNEINNTREELYGRIEEMLKIARKYLSNHIMMELLDAAYPPVKEDRYEDDEA